MLLDFPGGHAIGTCATQMAPGQGVTITGTLGRIEIEIPFNAPPDRPSRIVVEERSGGAVGREAIDIDICDQYTIQGDLFSEAARRGAPAPYPLEDSVRNLRVIDALFRSAQTNGWHAVA
jgi:predicted dehydrogenase